MTEIQALIEQNYYNRKRLLGILREISQHPSCEEALHWQMPFGSGRAHIGWQFMHCAATYDRYIHVRLKKGEPRDKILVERYAGGSKPEAGIKVTPQEIEKTLEESTHPFYDFFQNLPVEKLNEKPHPDADRTFREVLHLLNWHEAEHSGQIQITWNAFKARN